MGRRRGGSAGWVWHSAQFAVPPPFFFSRGRNSRERNQPPPPPVLMYATAARLFPQGSVTNVITCRHTHDSCPATKQPSPQAPIDVFCSAPFRSIPPGPRSYFGTSTSTAAPVASRSRMSSTASSPYTTHTHILTHSRMLRSYLTGIIVIGHSIG